MSVSKVYSPQEVELKWYDYWVKNGYFNSVPHPDKKPYTIVMPPPNVTGVLHMGHMLNNTIQDVLIRRARMRGYNACWVPGTDHASIATEAKVVAKLKDEGTTKEELGREVFLEHAWEWKEKYGGIILQQLKELGCSLDWSRTRFTMEDELSKAVIKVFVDLHEKGYIYRGVRMVNWDPAGKTALSDEEVIHKEAPGKLYFVKYIIEGTSDFITIATTRPETIPADVAVCVNPEDERYLHLKGKNVIVPFVNKPVPVIFDEYVDKDFGTGCLKITPAHDINDYNIGMKHGLPVIDLLNEDGTLNAHAGEFAGMERFKARNVMSKKLIEWDLIVKIEEITNKVGHSERTNAIIEPRLSRQWFCKMDQLAAPAIKAVAEGEIILHPAKFVNTYNHWMENIRDWCISRQLWWGHRIPAYYLATGETVVAETAEEALAKAKEITGNRALTLADLSQDEDVLDTWFSSWLWPMSVFDGVTKPGNPDINYYYPTQDLVTAPEILFFWVARMIMAGYEYNGKLPFKNVYLHGIVRDKQGRKMSKSLGNSPNPLDLIKQYGADGLRVGVLLCSPAGNDILFDEKLCEQGRNFCNKLWNSYRLLAGWNTDASLAPTAESFFAVRWFEARMNQELLHIEDCFEKYRISEALMSIYKLIWDDFCSKYLELVKPEFEKPIDETTLKATTAFLEKLLALAHPFMPFITEEIYQNLQPRTSAEALVISSYPISAPVDENSIKDGDLLFDAVSAIRNIRNEKQISPKLLLELYVKTPNSHRYKSVEGAIKKLAGLSNVIFTDEKPAFSVSVVVKSDELSLPVGNAADPEKEKENLLKELKYTEGFLASVDKKLSNERFVAGAPEDVLQKEQQKRQDALDKIKALRESLDMLTAL